MPSRALQNVLRDILDNIDLAQSFVAGMSFEHFRADRRTVYAVVRCLEIISEASRRLPSEFKEGHPAIRWGSMAGAGNIYRHGYEEVADRLIWQTVQDSLGSLRSIALAELARSPK
jgi:uncharacterized protein with HEPN domain